MRKLPLSLLAVGAFALAYAAGAHSCACAYHRRARRRTTGAIRGHERADEAALARYELAASWARQAMFGSA